MDALPTMLKLEGRRTVVVGGGNTALRRARSLHQAGARVTVIAPHHRPELDELDVELIDRPYEDGDLAGAWLVVVATDSDEVNEQVAAEAERRGVLTNRADRPKRGDLTIPAHAETGPITLAVTTDGVSARAAAVIRDQLLGQLDRDWVRLLETVGPFREQLQNEASDEQRRTEALHRLTDPEAMKTLKEQGEDALHRHCQYLLEWARM